MFAASDRLRNIPARPAHGQRGQDLRQPAGGLPSAHPRVCGGPGRRGASRLGGGDAPPEDRSQHGDGPVGQGAEKCAPVRVALCAASSAFGVFLRSPQRAYALWGGLIRG